jgi:uncharacterized protein (DUF305 family)
LTRDVREPVDLASRYPRRVAVDTRATDEPDDVVERRAVTPWRFGWWRTIALIVVLCFAAGVVGWMVGRPTDPSFNDADTGFLADMTDHHLGAITLAFAYLDDANDTTVKAMAREVARYQSQEIGSMNGLLAEAGDPASAHDPVAMKWMGNPVPRASMPGLATKADYDALAAATGLEADDLFTELMIQHHAAGAAMAEEEGRLGENEATRRLASAIARQQRDEIEELNFRRTQLGLPAVEPNFDLHTTG